MLVGICGPQDSGKSTACERTQVALEAVGYHCVTLPLDDFYLSRDARRDMAARVHPLFMTRGVPGTHDIALAYYIITRLLKEERGYLPQFDKANDTCAPTRDWPLSPEKLDVILFEGWCIGARPQEAEQLLQPVNTLEALEDLSGTWRSTANFALTDDYQALFSLLNKLCLICAPHFEIKQTWREEQEATLRQALINKGESGAHLMSQENITLFVSRYERLTRHIASEMPARADVVIQLNTQRAVVAVTRQKRQ